jgi:lipopolysaccharide transport system ATP-binding protein
MRMDSNTAIRLANISKCYHIYDRPQDRLKQLVFPSLRRLIGMRETSYHRDFWALDDVSFEVKKGTTVGIVGRNGSGKSTLLQIICGTLAATRGTVEARGRIAALLELGSGFNPEFTGRENVELNAALLGLTRDEIRDRFDAIVAFADIGDFIDQPIRTYSSGMVVRLAFAVAINADPEILVVDEALSVGDELFQRKCFSRIENIKYKGATILLVSHSGSTVVELCDEAILLDGGEKLAIGAPKMIVANYQRLVYAPDDSRAAIREEIRSAKTLTAAMPARPLARENAGREEEKNTALDPMEEFLDVNLTPQSTVEFESHGVFIHSVKILTLPGKQVNNLKRGRIYRYTYRVRVDRPVADVRFGMLLKTMSGTELGGSVSASTLGQSIPILEAGAHVSVEFRFVCSLSAGTYFLNAGVTGTRAGDETYLHRVLDGCVFRVLPEPASTITGYVDFGCESEFSVVSASHELQTVAQ